MSSTKTDRHRNVRQLQTLQPRVRLGTFLNIIPVLRDLGKDPIRLLTQAGADASLFDDPENRVSYTERGQWIAHCVERTGCRHLGLLIGQRNNLHSLALIGLLAKYSPDVESALRTLLRYWDVHMRGAVVTFSSEGRSASLGFETSVPEAEANDQVEDAAMASAFNILRALCGPDWNPSEVRFAHGKPEDVRPYRKFFRAPLLFGDEQNAVVFDSRWLQHRLLENDPELHRLLLNQVKVLQTKFGDDFPDQVRSILSTALLSVHGSADQVASLLSMHSRTLNRRFAMAGTSFRELVDESRFAIARQMLTNTGADISRVADVLSYADSSAFTRAFRRWSGTTPAAWREEQGRRSGTRRAARR